MRSAILLNIILIRFFTSTPHKKYTLHKMSYVLNYITQQYILKLRKESSDELKPDIAQMLPELTLESCRMGKVYSGILKDAKTNRIKEENKEDKEPVFQAKESKRAAEARKSPLAMKLLI